MSALAPSPSVPRRGAPVVRLLKCSQTGKTVYSSGEEAEREVAIFQARKARPKNPVRGYHCQHCGFWHLTSRPR